MVVRVVRIDVQVLVRLQDDVADVATVVCNSRMKSLKRVEY